VSSLWITFLSLLTAVVMVTLFLPQFNHITGKHLGWHFDINHMAWVLVLLLTTGLIAGSYPAFYLSGFNPVTVLKGNLKASVGEVWTRKGLVVTGNHRARR
jgi:ABC-type antimicrobial peptide transport system permease subunit